MEIKAEKEKPKEDKKPCTEEDLKKQRKHFRLIGGEQFLRINKKTLIAVKGDGNLAILLAFIVFRWQGKLIETSSDYKVRTQYLKDRMFICLPRYSIRSWLPWSSTKIQRKLKALQKLGFISIENRKGNKTWVRINGETIEKEVKKNIPWFYGKEKQT